MRRVIAVALSFATLVAGIGAPLVHAHPDDETTDHHDGRAVHAHWDRHTPVDHSADTPVVDERDRDRAVSVAVFVAVASSLPQTEALTHRSFELPVPEERAPHRTFDLVRSHDPPCIRSRSSRAPPAFLS